MSKLEQSNNSFINQCQFLLIYVQQLFQEKEIVLIENDICIFLECEMMQLAAKHQYMQTDEKQNTTAAAALSLFILFHERRLFCLQQYKAANTWQATCENSGVVAIIIARIRLRSLHMPRYSMEKGKQLHKIPEPLKIFQGTNKLTRQQTRLFIQLVHTQMHRHTYTHTYTIESRHPYLNVQKAAYMLSQAHI